MKLIEQLEQRRESRAYKPTTKTEAGVRLSFASVPLSPAQVAEHLASKKKTQP
jgi:hypothetical protein